jgi:hypoxanthine-guanine phosphoribosyltransferase
MPYLKRDSVLKIIDDMNSWFRPFESLFLLKQFLKEIRLTELLCVLFNHKKVSSREFEIWAYFNGFDIKDTFFGVSRHS